MRRFSFLFAVAMTVGMASPSLACSPPPTAETKSDDLLSPVPAKNAPPGAIQLKVTLLEKWDENANHISFRVLQVLDGKFDNDTVQVNITNVNFCNNNIQSAGIGLGDEAYVTVLPLKFADGEPARDKAGRPEFGAIFYEAVPFALLLADDIPEFAEYSPYEFGYFLNNEALRCLDEGHGGGMLPGEVIADKVWRSCVQPGEYISVDCAIGKSGAFICEEENLLQGRPADLRRGYSIWDQPSTKIILGLMAILTIFMALGLVWKVRRRAND